jgi:uncharacterized protein
MHIIFLIVACAIMVLSYGQGLDAETILKVVEEKKKNLDPMSSTPLIDALDIGELAYIKEIIEKKVDLNVRNDKGQTALMIASERGMTKTVEYLLDADADIYAKDNNGDTALALAMKAQQDLTVKLIQNHIEAELLLESKTTEKKVVPPSSASDFMRAVSTNKIDKVKQMLLSDTNIDIDKFKDKHGTPVLMLAARKGFAQIVTLLLEHGADVNLSTPNGNTALMFASEKGLSEIVQILITKSINIRINAQTAHGLTALMFAASNKNGLDTCKILISAGAKANIIANNFDVTKTAIDMAKEKENIDIVHFLQRFQRTQNALDKFEL